MGKPWKEFERLAAFAAETDDPRYAIEAEARKLYSRLRTAIDEVRLFVESAEKREKGFPHFPLGGRATEALAAIAPDLPTLPTLAKLPLPPGASGVAVRSFEAGKGGKAKRARLVALYGGDFTDRNAAPVVQETVLACWSCLAGICRTDDALPEAVLAREIKAIREAVKRRPKRG